MALTVFGKLLNDVFKNGEKVKFANRRTNQKNLQFSGQKLYFIESICMNEVTSS
jgi:hypothetical protein